MKKTIATVLVCAIMLGLIANANALALTGYSTSTTSIYTTMRTKAYFNVASSTITTSGSATKLTLRAYKFGGSKNSDARTYKSGEATGGQYYWDASVSSIDMRGNIDASGWVKVDGTWVF